LDKSTVIESRDLTTTTGMNSKVALALSLFALRSTNAVSLWGSSPAEDENKECPYSFSLLSNGAATNGVSAILPENASLMTGAELAAWAAGQVGGFEPDCVDCKLFDASARQITHCSQMMGEYPTALTSNTQSGAKKEPEVWVAAPGRWFVFPTGELGRAVKVSRVKPPRGENFPITVETIRFAGFCVLLSVY
jgi:hypothetical protein